ncbi:MAG TPA: hypothetical protein VM938_15060 [Acidimicrobiales bacterium]|nr:hypothetical protein [Acidimicrobiales bacterium]
MNEERAQEAVEHLQAAAREMIAAARALLDVAEDLVADPAPLLAVVSALGDLVPRPKAPEADETPVPTSKVQRIRVS